MQNPVFDSSMPVFTHFGGFIFLVLIMVAVILYAHITKRRTLRKVAVITLDCGTFLWRYFICLKAYDSRTKTVYEFGQCASAHHRRWFKLISFRPYHYNSCSGCEFNFKHEGIVRKALSDYWHCFSDFCSNHFIFKDVCWSNTIPEIFLQVQLSVGSVH